MSESFDRVNAFLKTRADQLPQLDTIASPSSLNHALLSLPRNLPANGQSTSDTVDLLLSTLVPASAQGQAGPRYFGFVTGGVTESSQLADMITTSLDQNQQVNLPGDTIANYIEAITLEQILSLLNLSLDRFPGRTITPGATSANILGLAIGREHVVKEVKRRKDAISDYSAAEEGTDIKIRVLCAGAHTSTKKAAAILGIGRKQIKELANDSVSEPCSFDLQKLEDELKAAYEQGDGVIVVSSIGEVNTGGITRDYDYLRQLCDKYQAWLHIDAAFGAFACLHQDFESISSSLDLADSITSDCHKWLNTPYDAGLFFCRSLDLLKAVCGPGQGPAAPYLAPGAFESTDWETEPQLASLQQYSAALPSPLFVNIENSRRFRALPIYASLQTLGRKGYRDIVVRNIDFARAVVKHLHDSADWDVLLPVDFNTMNIVLFAPSASARVSTAAECVKAINATRRMYVSATTWKGRAALRMAVTNWSTDMERDLPIVLEVLQQVMRA